MNKHQTRRLTVLFLLERAGVPCPGAKSFKKDMLARYPQQYAELRLQAFSDHSRIYGPLGTKIRDKARPYNGLQYPHRLRDMQTYLPGGENAATGSPVRPGEPKTP